MYVLLPYGIHNLLALKCHCFTLTDALVTVQTINLSVPDSELKKRAEWKRCTEQIICFLTINQVQPTLFL